MGNNTNVHQMTPTLVEVYRCAGGCQTGHGGKLCVPLETRTRSVSVILGKCGCGCDQEQHDKCLLSVDHVWRQESCQCQCRDVQGRRECQENGHQWSELSCTCANQNLVPFIRNEDNSAENKSDTNSPEDGSLSLTREIVVILLLSAINGCLLFIMILLFLRLKTVKEECSKITTHAEQNENDYYQVCSDDNDDSYLKGPKMISNNTYSEIDIYSASSGFVSEDGREEGYTQRKICQQPYYETAESVRLKSIN